MVGRTMTALVTFLLSGQLHSTSLPPATSSVTSGMSGASATFGRLLRTVATARAARTSPWMATPAQRAAAIATSAIRFVVYSVSMSVPPVSFFPNG